MKSSTAPRTGLAKLVSTLPRLWAITPAAVGESIAHRRRPTAFRRWACAAPRAGRVGVASCAGGLPLAALLSARIVVGRAVRNLRQQSEQRARDSDRVGVAQRLAGVPVTRRLRRRIPGRARCDAPRAGERSFAAHRRQRRKWPRSTDARSSRIAVEHRPAHRFARRIGRGARRTLGGRHVPARPSPTPLGITSCFRGTTSNVAR